MNWRGWAAALPDAGNDILQTTAVGVMVENVSHGDGWHTGCLRSLFDSMEPQMLVGGEAPDQRHIGAVAEGLPETREIPVEVFVRFIA